MMFEGRLLLPASASVMERCSQLIGSGYDMATGTAKALPRCHDHARHPDLPNPASARASGGATAVTPSRGGLCRPSPLSAPGSGQSFGAPAARFSMHLERAIWPVWRDPGLTAQLSSDASARLTTGQELPKFLRRKQKSLLLGPLQVASSGPSGGAAFRARAHFVSPARAAASRGRLPERSISCQVSLPSTNPMPTATPTATSGLFLIRSSRFASNDAT